MRMDIDLSQLKIDFRVEGETAAESLMRQPESWRQNLTEAIYKRLSEGKSMRVQEIFRTCRAMNREKQRKAGLISW